jgi:hypothetical protein
MTANRTAGRTLGALAAVAVAGGVGLLVLAPPSGVALASPGVYGLALLGAGGGLLVALGYLSVTSTAGTAEQPAAAPEPDPQPTPDPTAGPDSEPAPEPDPEPESEPEPQPDPDPAPNAAAGSGGTGSVQELFEGSTDDETEDIDALLEGAAEDSSFEFSDEDLAGDDRT